MDAAEVVDASGSRLVGLKRAEDGSIVEIVLLDAKKEGLLPVEYRQAA